MSRSHRASALLFGFAALAATPALAQAGATHVDATGAAAGRSPHKAMRQAAAEPNCGKTVSLPAGKLPTYGNPALDPRCRAPELARAETAKDVARD